MAVERLTGISLPILAGILAGTVRIGVSLTFVWFCKHLIDTATHQADGNIILDWRPWRDASSCNCCCPHLSAVSMRTRRSACATDCGRICSNIS